MKTLILSTILLLPCLAAFSEEETFLPNIFELAYVFGLYLAGQFTAVRTIFNITKKRLIF